MNISILIPKQNEMSKSTSCQEAVSVFRLTVSMWLTYGVRMICVCIESSYEVDIKRLEPISDSMNAMNYCYYLFIEN